MNKPEIYWNISEQMRRHQEAFERSCKRWEEMEIGTKVKIPWFTMSYSKEMQFKTGTVVDKLPPNTLLVDVNGVVNEYSMSLIRDI